MSKKGKPIRDTKGGTAFLPPAKIAVTQDNAPLLTVKYLELINRSLERIAAAMEKVNG